jgi:hypothetical protein
MAWILFPAQISGTSPANLSAIYKENYRSQIALAYAASGDAGRAAARLGLLGDRDPIRELNVQAQLALLDQDSQREARALSQLSQAIYGLVVDRLEQEDGGEIILLENSKFDIREQQRICESANEAPTLRLFLLDAEGTAQSGWRMVLSSDSGEEESFTGLRPELGAGYAQFDLFPNEIYALEIQDIATLEGIAAPDCLDEDGESYWGSWLFTLRAN